MYQQTIFNHCCVCSGGRSCYHLGPPRYCLQHGAQGAGTVSTQPTYPASPPGSSLGQLANTETNRLLNEIIAMLNSVLVQKDRGTQVPQMPSESELTGFDIRHAYDINTDSWVIQAIIPLGGTGFTREKETLELVKKDVRAAIEKRLKDEPRRET